ncbi:MAG: DUF2283 domain-containing protein [Chloroflexota bacterium]|nr:DUF2283 domain-containing protein [Chloroflexota bacterium]MDE2670690.1 DUF2283 domain-containing protein [Chloroflexota bacterium]
MKVSYDRQADALSIVLRDVPVADTDEYAAGLILDLDEAGEVVAIEVLDASLKTDPNIFIALATPNPS